MKGLIGFARIGGLRYVRLGGLTWEGGFTKTLKKRGIERTNQTEEK